MHKYVHYSCRTLFAGLLLIGVTRCNDVPTETIFVTSHKYEANGTTISAQPSVYSLDSAYFIPLGAPKEGCKKAALTKIALATAEVSEFAHKTVIMNNTPKQPSPLYNQKIIHVCTGTPGVLYAVTAAQPDTIYRYSQFDSDKTATVHGCKLIGPDDKPCTIVRMVVGSTGISEFVVAEIAPRDGSGEHAIACARSITKHVAPPKKSPEVIAAEQRIYAEQDKNLSQEEKEDLNKEREAESKKLVAKYVFGSYNLHSNTEGAGTSVVSDFLPQEMKDQGSWHITNMQFLNSSLFVEVCLNGTDLHRLLSYETNADVSSLVPLAACQGYHRAIRKAPLLSWEHTPSICLSNFNRKQNYCLVVGDLASHKESYKSLVAFCITKKDILAPMKIGGEGILPGPISDVKSENETVYVSVAQSDTDAQPGVFYSQAIFDGTGAIAAWSSWQRTAGSSESVVGIMPNEGGLRTLLCDPQQKDQLRLHTLKWRGRSVRIIEAAFEQSMAGELAKQELVKQQLEQRKVEQEALAQKERATSGAVEVAEKDAPKTEVEKPELPCVKNEGFAFGKGLIPSYQSSQLQLCSLFESFDAQLGGVRKMIDVPATKDSAASFVIAVGYNRVLFAQTNQKSTPDGKLITRQYNAPVHAHGAINLEYVTHDNAEAMVCVDGALQDLGFIDAVHVASNGTDSWVVVAGPLGVAVLSAHNGEGVSARTGFGDCFKGIKQKLTFKLLGNYQWVRNLISDDQFLYITTEDSIERIPLKRTCFADNATPETCTLATGDDIGKVCDGYVFNDVCISHGMIIAATPGGLVVTAPGVDCRKATNAMEVVWQSIPLPAACTSIEHLVPVSTTGRAQDVACKGQLYVIACSLFDETASITRLFIDKDTIENRIQLVPDVRKKTSGTWLNFVHRISAFMTDGSIHLVGRARFEGRTVDLAKVTAGTKRNSGASQFAFDENTHQINTIMRSSGSGSVFVAADDGVRVYE